jgi:hypothetical protein
MEAMLNAPQFLYRIETGQPTGTGDDRIRLTPFEVATRISYLIAGTMPDPELFAAAAEGRLDTPAGRHAQARRLLADKHTETATR